MTLPTPEEFNFMLSSVARDDAYAAAYALTETQAVQLDSALASLADARTKFEAMLGEPVCHCGDDVSAHSERSNHSPMELWPPEVAAVFEAFRAAVTPGRGEKLLRAVEAARMVWSQRAIAGTADFDMDMIQLGYALDALDADGAAS